MSDIKCIRWNTVPCWYELSWRDKLGMVLRIHSDYASKNRKLSPDAPIVEDFIKRFGFSGFGAEFGKDFGFENSLRFLGEADGFLEYSIPTPLVRKITDEKCFSCEGSGKNIFYEEENCQFCDGGGRGITYDYANTYAVSATLTTLFTWMRFPEMETSCPLPQLMTVQTTTLQTSGHGSEMFGEYSREAVRWMRRRGAGHIPEMVLAMRSAWAEMDGRVKSVFVNDFRAYLSDDNGWLCTDCPGDACGIFPSHQRTGDGDRGYEFSSHNTDNPMQQLTILASLAVLHDLIRKEA